MKELRDRGFRKISVSCSWFSLTLLELLLIPILRRYNFISSHSDMVLVDKCKERCPLGRNRIKWADNIKTDL